jgi:hypothetical protein
MSRRKNTAVGLTDDIYKIYIENIIDELNKELLLLNHKEPEIYIIDATHDGVRNRTGKTPPLPNSLLVFKFPNILYIVRIEFKNSHIGNREALSKQMFNLEIGDWTILDYSKFNSIINHGKNKWKGGKYTDITNDEFMKLI